MSIRVIMSPEPGHSVVAHCGDHWSAYLQVHGITDRSGWKAYLRTTIGRGHEHMREQAAPISGERLIAGIAQRDIPMTPTEHGWQLDVALPQVGYYHAKAFAVDPHGRAHWPSGDDCAVAVHPAWSRAGNTLYCAFVRQFGPNRDHRSTANPLLEAQLNAYDKHGWTVIPPSGTFRDLTGQLDHIFGTLGCRILHLLPVNPTPTTHARYGRFGSPYAATDFTAVDPALVVHDRTTTGLDQFRELADGVHRRDGRLFLDLAINHTGWMSRLQEEHPEWFVRNEDGSFHSPGAWGNTWADLVELNHNVKELWSELADAMLTWCRRGVDGFRCDAGYMIPTPVWQAIVSTVQLEFPDTVFLLEGLGGAWEATADLLTNGRMQWAYSELFQNYSASELTNYLDHQFNASAQTGTLINYAETHDNNRLAAKGRAWSLHRNRVNALTSQGGGYGITAGVEWLADEKIDVHQNRGLNWGSEENLVSHIADLNRLLQDHPCFQDGAHCRRISSVDAPIVAIERLSAFGQHHVLVLINCDDQREHRFTLPDSNDRQLGAEVCDLINFHSPPPIETESGKRTIVLAPLRCVCLSAINDRVPGNGTAYRRLRHCHASAITVLSTIHGPEHVAVCNWHELACRFSEDPEHFMQAALQSDRETCNSNVIAALEDHVRDRYVPLITWMQTDANRVVPVPPEHWILIRDLEPFRYTFTLPNGQRHDGAAIATERGYIAIERPQNIAGDGTIEMRSCGDHHRTHRGSLLHLAQQAPPAVATTDPEAVLLLTNSRGGMARMRADFGSVRSKYDCVLGANLHQQWPVDRHVLVKRVRGWLRTGQFSFPIDAKCLICCRGDGEAHWEFSCPAGDGRTVPLTVRAHMPDQANATIIEFSRHPDRIGIEEEVTLVIRVDIEDRSFHSETQYSDAANDHFVRHLSHDTKGFSFTPARDRELRVESSHGCYHQGPEWATGIGHPVEANRGQIGEGSAYSPGWFEIPLTAQHPVQVVCSADKNVFERSIPPASHDDTDWGQRLNRALDAYLVRRDDGTTIIAGYPWFLDWGRDTLICARGVLAAGRTDEVVEILKVFGKFEQGGTLPNAIHGGDASNRETSDAALWYGVVAEETAAIVGDDLYDHDVGDGRSLGQVLRDIAVGHLKGTTTGVHCDRSTYLVWSPAHFTWMDTNHPAGTPRVGYPIEIQVLWWRLLKLLASINAEPTTHGPWAALADTVRGQINQRYWLDEHGWWSDVLHAASGTSATDAVVNTALRSNCLHVIALDAATGERARRCIEAARQHLVIPGALRSLAPLPVQPPLAVTADDGRPLIDPHFPYQGRYEGDEDTRRKPAYHNGTAWTWPYPVFCEALMKAYGQTDAARLATRSYLLAMDQLLHDGCHGQIPEICDGDAPHEQRGCDAQAWGVSEALRLWRLLEDPSWLTDQKISANQPG